MGIFDMVCEECSQVVSKGDDYTLSKKTRKTYTSIKEFQEAEKRVFGCKSICEECYKKFSNEQDVKEKFEEDGYIQTIPVTTTGTIEGRKIIEYRGVVGTQVIFGANIIKDLVASFTDFTGGRSGTIEKILKEGRSEVVKQLIVDAISEGANAIIGLKIDIETTAQMYMLHATGTAVIIEKENAIATPQEAEKNT